MKKIIIFLTLCFSVNAFSQTTFIVVDTVVHYRLTDSEFREQIKNRLNKYKPGGVIEFKLPLISEDIKQNYAYYYTSDSSAYISYDIIIPNNLSNEELLNTMYNRKYMKVDKFIYIIEQYNCRLIYYDYSQKIGLFRIGSMRVVRDWIYGRF